MAQKTDGNWDDVTRVVKNIKNGHPWHIAKGLDAFMAVEDHWYEHNKARFFQWADTGIPQQVDNISLINRAPEPLQVVSTPDGKVWAVYRDNAGKLYREEVSTERLLAEAATPPPPVEESKLAVPGAPPDAPIALKSEGKPKAKSW